jgi:hypothetical protein
MDEPLRHRQTKGAETDMPGLPPPRHIPTLPRPTTAWIERQWPEWGKLRHPRSWTYRQLGADFRHW